MSYDVENMSWLFHRGSVRDITLEEKDLRGLFQKAKKGGILGRKKKSVKSKRFFKLL